MKTKLNLQNVKLAIIEMIINEKKNNNINKIKQSMK